MWTALKNLIPVNVNWTLIKWLSIAGLIVSGWAAYAWERSTLQDLRLADSTAALKSEQAARGQEAAWRRSFSQIDQQISQLEADRVEISKLRAAVDAGSVRLHVAAHCSSLSDAAGGSGLGHDAAPELDAAARPDYFALREGLAVQFRQLSACQAILRAERDGGADSGG